MVALRGILQFLLLWHVVMYGWFARFFFYAITAIFQTGPYLIGLGGFLTAILCLVSLASVRGRYVCADFMMRDEAV